MGQPRHVKRSKRRRHPGALGWLVLASLSGLAPVVWAQSQPAPFTYTPLPGSTSTLHPDNLPVDGTQPGLAPGKPRRTKKSAAAAATSPPAPAAEADAGVADDTGFGSADDSEFGAAPPPVATIKMHGYTLAECLALADRNHPAIWAARARLAYVHGQLDEAKWTPFWNWSASSTVGVIPTINGTNVYSSTPATALGTSFFSQQLGPFFTFDISGTLPIYTFGKITEAREAAQSNVRVTEWDMEKTRQQTRMDVRRAYFGLMLARDSKYIIKDVTGQLDKAIQGVADKLAQDDKSVEDIDRIRLETYRDELHARTGEADKGERFGIAALRFMTGVQTAFDIPDEPLKRPVNTLGPVSRYLTAARLFRPEVNQARAGVVAREHLLEYQKAQFFPNIGLGLGASYAVAPTVVPGANAVNISGLNHFIAPTFGVGVQWGLDLLPKKARVSQAEAQLEETRALERLALGGIAVEVEQAYGTALEASTREASWEAAEHRARRWISIVDDAIDLGTKDERALNEPLRAYVNARVNHVYALMEMNVAFSDLARVTGVDDVAPD
jgi:multidrug efflux system outer membrane protein